LKVVTKILKKTYQIRAKIFHCQRMKLFTIYRSVDDCEKGPHRFKSIAVHIKSQKLNCVMFKRRPVSFLVYYGIF